MDYPCGKFGYRSFSRFGLLRRQTESHTHKDELLTPATVVGLSN